MIPAPRQSLAPFVRQRLPSGIVIATARFASYSKTPAFFDYCMKRYEEGEREHGFRHDWLEWPPSRAENECLQEFADGCIYPAMELVAQDFRDARSA